MTENLLAEMANEKFILIMKANDETSLTECVTTVCKGAGDLISTILRYAADDELREVVDGNVDWDEVREEVEAMVVTLHPDEENEDVTFDIGLNDEDDYPGLEVFIKIIAD